MSGRIMDSDLFTNFSERAQRSMDLAQQEAYQFSNEYVGTEHILLGIVREGAGVGAHALKSGGIHYFRLKAEINKIITIRLNNDVQSNKRSLPLTPRSKKVIELAIKNAHELGHKYIGTEHLLLGLIEERDGVAAQIIQKMGLTYETVRSDIMNIIGQDDPRQSEEEQINALFKSYQQELKDAIILSREKSIDITAAFVQIMTERRGHG